MIRNYSKNYISRTKIGLIFALFRGEGSEWWLSSSVRMLFLFPLLLIYLPEIVEELIAIRKDTGLLSSVLLTGVPLKT